MKYLLVPRVLAMSPIEKELLEALECAETILILLKDEAERLGCRGEHVLPKVQAAIWKARGLK